MRRLGVAVLLLAVIVTGALLALRWPSATTLDCPPGDVHLDDHGVARCAPGGPLSARQTLTAGGKLDLNRCTAEELTAVPGVGRTLATHLVAARGKLDGGFHDWDEVDRVAGVGQARLDSLKASTELR